MSEEQKCRGCGCTQSRACDGGCYWVEPDLCSACHRPISGVSLSQNDLDAIAALPRIQLELDGPGAFMLMATIQLACRHPSNSGITRQYVEEVARDLAEYLSVTPGLGELCAKGFDSTFDIPSERRIIVP